VYPTSSFEDNRLNSEPTASILLLFVGVALARRNAGDFESVTVG
jgi:hypothetical protein